MSQVGDGADAIENARTQAAAGSGHKKAPVNPRGPPSHPPCIYDSINTMNQAQMMKMKRRFQKQEEEEKRR
jgi:hypothetical protein